MGFAITKADGKKAVEKLQRLKARMQTVANKANEVVEVGVRSIEVNAGAFAAGMMEGYWGAKSSIFGMPAPLVGGAAGHAIGFAMSGENAKHLHNFSDGFLAAWSCATGRGIGQQLKSKAKASGLLDDE